MDNRAILNLSEKQTQRIVWTLLSIFPIIGMTVDLVAPSLPAIASSLSISTTLAKNVITFYLLGYAFGNFFIGFLTDAWGRQKLIRISVLGFSLVSLLPVLSHRVDILFLSRFLQGLTMGAFSVLSRAIFADILPTEKLTRLGTWIGTMWGLGPVLGPVIGGYLQFYFNWQAGFIFFTVTSFIGFIPLWIIVPETHFNRQRLDIKTIKTNLSQVISHRLFMALVFLMGIAYSLIIIFNTSGPFLIQTALHYSPVFFGHVALWLGLVFLVSTFTCRHLLKKYSMEKMLSFAIIIGFIISMLAVILSFTFEKNIWFAGIFSALMFFACGFIFPMSMGKGISLFRHITGTATALMYLIQILMTSLVAFLVSFVRVENNTDIMWMYCVLLLCAILVYCGMIRERKIKI